MIFPFQNVIENLSVFLAGVKIKIKIKISLKLSLALFVSAIFLEMVGWAAVKLFFFVFVEV